MNPPAHASVPPTILRKLQEKRFSVRGALPLASAEPALDTLSLLLGVFFQDFRELLLRMRGNLQDNPGFYLRLENLDERRISSIGSICHLLQRNGILEQYRIEHGAKRLSGAVARNDRAFHFISGDWLERCIHVGVTQFLNLDGPKIELIENLEVVRPCGRNFEFDLLLAVDETLYWWEAKSGCYSRENLNRYREVAAELGIPRKQAFLVIAEPQDGLAPEEIADLAHMTVLAPDEVAARIERIEIASRRN